MSHLSLETIARIVDDGPTAGENGHLDSCASCRADLEAMRDDVQALAMLPDITPAADAWDALEARLAGEGLLQRAPQRSYNFPIMRFAQLAAAVTLFAAGTLAGRLGTNAEPANIAQLPAGGVTSPAVETGGTQMVTGSVSPESNAALEPGAGTLVEAPQATLRNSSVTLASNNAPAFVQPRTLEEAAALLRQTEQLYVSALTRYAELSTQSEPGDPVARLAALQSIVMTTQAALSQTPADPVINGYHLTALAQRDAALRQVAATSGERWY